MFSAGICHTYRLLRSVLMVFIIITAIISIITIITTVSIVSVSVVVLMHVFVISAEACMHGCSASLERMTYTPLHLFSQSQAITEQSSACHISVRQAVYMLQAARLCSRCTNSFPGIVFHPQRSTVLWGVQLLRCVPVSC